MASSQSYADFERDYNTHLSKIRSFLAQPLTTPSSPNYAANIAHCEQALENAKKCVHAMQGMAEIEGDPFKLDGAKRKLREMGPLEEEIKGRKKASGGNMNGGSAGGESKGSGFMSSVFNKTNGAASSGVGQGNSSESYLFGNRRSYAPPSLGGDDNEDVENGESSFRAPLTEMERRMQDSEHLLRETQALCAESEQIGASTLETMGRQREQLDRSSGFVQDSIERTEQARRIMKEMAYRAFKNKLFLYCVIALLLLANGAVIAHLWRRKK